MAMARASGDYIILIDGDVVLHEDFVKDHLKFARKGFFTQGGRVLLSGGATRKAIEEESTAFKFGLLNLKSRRKAFHSEILAKAFRTESSALKGVRTCNFALWKEDALMVNGFNEDFVGWGREDSEFAARLLHNGLRRQNIRFHAIAYHLHHPVRPLDALPANDALLAETVEKKLLWCRNGISRRLDGKGPEADGD
jgi:predicted glycosyltransferase involved in capsule biosynthesis